MLKKFSLAIALVAVMSVGAKADDLDVGSIDVASISDADNLVVEANVDVDVDSLANGTGDNDVAVEACFRRWGGGCGYNYGCYRSCYYPCYSYSYCYYPSYFCYRPVCYTPVYYSCYYPLYNWGCY